MNFSFGRHHYCAPGEYTEDIVMKEGSLWSAVVHRLQKWFLKFFRCRITHLIRLSKIYISCCPVLSVEWLFNNYRNILLHQGSDRCWTISLNYEHTVISKNIVMNFSIAMQAVGYAGPPVNQSWLGTIFLVAESECRMWEQYGFCQ